MQARSLKTAVEQDPLLGFCSMYASPGIIERLAPDWDWCWIDCQHGEWSPHDVVRAVRTCDLMGIFSMVRAPGHDAGLIGTILDTACHAVLVPMVNNGEQAKAVVAAAKFAPLGSRSYGGRRPFDLYGAAYADPDHPQPLLTCQIETPEAVHHVDAIAATAGVDALFFGPDDLALAKGMRMGQPRPVGCFDEELAMVAAAAQRHGKIAAGVAQSPEQLQQMLALGFRLLACTADVRLLAQYSPITAHSYRAAPGK